MKKTIQKKPEIKHPSKSFNFKQSNYTTKEKNWEGIYNIL